MPDYARSAEDVTGKLREPTRCDTTTSASAGVALAASQRVLGISAACENPVDDVTNRGEGRRRAPKPIREALVQMAVIVAGMSGVFLVRLTPLRVLTTCVVIAAALALWIFNVEPSFHTALTAYVIGFATRYAVLFLSFARGGIAERLRARLGETDGFAVYESVTALLFFVRGVTFAWLIGTTNLSISAMGGRWAHAVIALGVILALGGTLVNVWATYVVGLDTYYYRDLFIGRLSGDLRCVGPYRVFRNPMYGVGQASGYGAALLSLSPAGVLATLFNQLTMYVFNELIERPHLARVRAGASSSLGGLPLD